MICIPIIDNTVEKALISAKEALKYGDIVEFRLDLLDNLTKFDIEKFAKIPSIITIRANWEGGAWKESNNKRIEFLKHAIKHGAKFIDVELKEEKNLELVTYRNEIGSKTKIIVSYHDFEKTPEINELIDVVEKELKIGDIAKFATFSNSKKDVLKILEVMNKYPGDIIAIGMGESGKLTRILGLRFGSILTFASMKGKSSAPGQIDVTKLKEILNLIE
ncbi:3-dehydroquinate dehydratase, type I [Methanococcus vannielii SB]|uniref:3-dehydroquinate dehydratase n=1 Tax=Methanococcus vannielii (strain ATCC 35089 / DSM 1224 / JCM 13029 / OCM 148 / SB) TaxID=406327 RepID=AROD_METVS|nr:type I 3-dehydroquinate dehydratase [Methanococcus vannielii]A6UQ39.1 RecName: Full=3-dehydroquinate dehydratase; Short=3-dehydroquinase; AltName: Full=Type I DHQase; AltName: Full=Type I dehydroquinase; Short=DHQ1 [Methanococcus vannielii SB]ABR54611.1 3-dehydroquinate dehydratase, type I [Methanococcus vannielii SB]